MLVIDRAHMRECVHECVTLGFKLSFRAVVVSDTTR